MESQGQDVMIREIKCQLADSENKCEGIEKGEG